MSGQGQVSGMRRVVVSGWRGVGKTTLCTCLISSARAAGWTTGGILTPERAVDGTKTGIFALDLWGGEQRLLASSLPREIDGAELGCWTFDESVLAWGNTLLADRPSVQLLALDEFGPLEFERNGGWWAGLKRWETGIDGAAVAVVRPELTDRILSLTPDARVFSLEGTAQQDRVLKEILAAIKTPLPGGERRG